MSFKRNSPHLSVTLVMPVYVISGLPCRHERALGDVPKNVVVGEVGKRGHVGSKLVDESVERSDDEASLADGKPGEIFVEALEEVVAVFALAWNASVASLARLVGEDHASESAVEELRQPRD